MKQQHPITKKSCIQTVFFKFGNLFQRRRTRTTIGNNILCPATCSRDIPTGEAVSPTSLSMQTEYDYYPLSTTEVKLTVTNYSQQEYMCGNDYSLTYYNNDKRQWETRRQPTRIIEDIAWILDLNILQENRQSSFISKVPNRAGKYRIWQTLTETP